MKTGTDVSLKRYTNWRFWSRAHGLHRNAYQHHTPHTISDSKTYAFPRRSMGTRKSTTLEQGKKNIFPNVHTGHRVCCPMWAN